MLKLPLRGNQQVGIMRLKKTLIGLIFIFPLLILHNMVHSAPACKGPNKNDPGCSSEEVAAPAPAPDPVSVIVENITVDWFNQKITLRGAGLTGATDFVLGGSAPLTPSSVTDTVVDINFDADIAGEVDRAGNYLFKVDGVNVLSLFFKSQVIDPAATGCSCDVPWANALVGYWGSLDTQCLEIPGPQTNDVADIAGTVLSVPNDPSVYPQYPIGAAFIPGDPVSSVCRVVQANGDASVDELVNLRINENQQAACAASLKANICASSAPPP